MKINSEEISNLAQSLAEILIESKFFDNPDNEEGFQKWLLSVENREDL